MITTDEMSYTELVGTDFDYMVDCQDEQIRSHPFTVTVNLTIEKHFETRGEAKDYAFCRHCFDGVPKQLIDIWDQSGSKVSKDVWNNNEVVA